MVGVLLVPAAGLFGLGVALLWLLTGGARIKGSPKALVLRRIAIAGTLLFTLFALPFLSLLR